MNHSIAKNEAKANFYIFLALIAAVTFFAISGSISYRNTNILNKNSKLVMHTHEVIISIDTALTLIKDAETGQRGYLITGEEKYLQPYNDARANIDHIIEILEDLTLDNDVQQGRIAVIKSYITQKMNELDETITLRRTQGFDAARAVVMTDRGKGAMDTIRSTFNEIKKTEQDLRQQRIAEMEKAYKAAIISGILSVLLGVFLSITVAYLIKRSIISRQRQEWLRTGIAGLSSSMLGDQKIDELSENILKFLADYFDAQVGAFYSRDDHGFSRVSTYGLPQEYDAPLQFEMGQGLLGQAAKDNTSFIIHEVPEGYISLGSALGKSKPNHLLISSAAADGYPNAVVELGFVHPVTDLSVQLMEQLSSAIGIAVRSANYRSHLQNLLEETQRQSEELQTQSEELRVSNEELEEQSRALKESQVRLELQQTELEQTNSQLEEQTQQLEIQKDDIEKAKISVEQKAEELEKASQYKSDFLANMSHELRTPLNSSLILAKLLADNDKGNLDEEQIKFAQTIQKSGNDLLSLINDILDLSKIEAGHMDVRIEEVSIARLTKDLTSVFEPLAKHKGLKFNTTIAKDSPQTLETDAQRLEQILKNLLSNAIKFTEKGSVELNVSQNGDSISFKIIDTGIGISEEHQRTVFDAFRQADSTISRKYGGTGLGLSISRELTRLLGGAMGLQSSVNEGSTFTIQIPITYSESQPTLQEKPASFTKTSAPRSAPQSVGAGSRRVSSPGFS